MRGGGVLLVRAAVADLRPHHAESRTCRVRLRFFDYPVNCLEVIDVREVQDLPAIRLETLRRIVSEREVGRAVDRYAVVVVEADELPEPEVSGEGRGLVRQPFHHVAVAAYEVGVMVDDLVPWLVEYRREVCLGERHPHRVADALAEGTRRRLYPWSVAVFGVTGSTTSPLTKLLEVFEAEVIAAQIQTRVQQHRRVTAREDEAIAIRPIWVGGIMTHVLRVEPVAERRERHRRPRVTRLRLLHGVHRQRADGIDGEEIEVGD